MATISGAEAPWGQVEENLANNMTLFMIRYHHLTEAIEATREENAGRQGSLDQGWVMICGMLVFFMQAGFSLLEAGSVSHKNLTNILFKNIMDACVSAVAFWLVGYGIAFGTTFHGFIGQDRYALGNMHGTGNWSAHPVEEYQTQDRWSFWFFQWAFAGTATTIVSGSVAERTKFEAYIIFSFFMSVLIYPVVVHWTWGHGFLSAWGANPDEFGEARPLLTGTSRSNGVVDFAGSGTVHMVGGFSGLIGALLVGPRRERFDPVTGRPNELYTGNSMLMCLGTMILWLGWYAFNCGSTLTMAGNAANVAGKVAVNTTIAATSACLTCTILTRIMDRFYHIAFSVNGVLAGLVSITGSCAVVEPWSAFLIGMIGAVLFYYARRALINFGVDDPLDAAPVHGCCGLWGLLASGIFCTDSNIQYAGYPNVNNACGSGEQFGVQLIAAVAISLWVLTTSGLIFYTINRHIGLRVSASDEEDGMDRAKHHSLALLQEGEAGEMKEGTLKDPNDSEEKPSQMGGMGGKGMAGIGSFKASFKASSPPPATKLPHSITSPPPNHPPKEPGDKEAEAEAEGGTSPQKPLEASQGWEGGQQEGASAPSSLPPPSPSHPQHKAVEEKPAVSRDSEGEEKASDREAPGGRQEREEGEVQTSAGQPVQVMGLQAIPMPPQAMPAIPPPPSNGAVPPPSVPEVVVQRNSSS